MMVMLYYYSLICDRDGDDHPHCNACCPFHVCFYFHHYHDPLFHCSCFVFHEHGVVNLV